VHPDWSPDGQRIVFAADDARQDGAAIVTRDLWVSDANGGNLDRVLDCELPCAEADDPAWSPDGRTLAFAVFDAKGDFNVNTRIAVLDLQTRRIRTITRAAGTDNLTGPRWSPDGRTLVFEVQHYTNLGLTGTITGTAIATVPVTDHVVAARVITPWSRCASYPDWHPTQDLILFSIYGCPKVTGPFDLFTVRSDGSHLTRVTRFQRQTRAIQPTFTPDGTHIIFATVQGDDIGSATMEEIALDGSGLTSATASGPMFGTHPRLRPTAG
jgi:Tol biopolymer transport system component